MESSQVDGGRVKIARPALIEWTLATAIGLILLLALVAIWPNKLEQGNHITVQDQASAEVLGADEPGMYVSSYHRNGRLIRLDARGEETAMAAYARGDWEEVHFGLRVAIRSRAWRLAGVVILFVGALTWIRRKTGVQS